MFYQLSYLSVYQMLYLPDVRGLEAEDSDEDSALVLIIFMNVNLNY